MRVLWVSYYSSHQKKTAIYLAKVKVDVRGIQQAVRATAYSRARQ